MQLIRLLVRQRPFQTPIINAVAETLPPRLRMRKLIYKLHILRQIPCNITHDLHHIIFMERRTAACSSSSRGWQPEGNILVACRVFREGDEAGDFASSELGEEARILGPEEADVWDVEEEHGDAFEAEAESPADAMRDVRRYEELLLDDAAAEDFEPVALPEYFEFPGRASEWEVGFDPADFERFLVRAGGFWGSFMCGREDFNNESFEGAFEVRCDRFCLFDAEVFCLQGVSLWVYGRVRVLDFNIVRGNIIGGFHDSLCGLP